MSKEKIVSLFDVDNFFTPCKSKVKEGVELKSNYYTWYNAQSKIVYKVTASTFENAKAGKFGSLTFVETGDTWDCGPEGEKIAYDVWEPTGGTDIIPELEHQVDVALLKAKLKGIVIE